MTDVPSSDCGNGLSLRRENVPELSDEPSGKFFFPSAHTSLAHWHTHLAPIDKTYIEREFT